MLNDFATNFPEIAAWEVPDWHFKCPKCNAITYSEECLKKTVVCKECGKRLRKSITRVVVIND